MNQATYYPTQRTRRQSNDFSFEKYNFCNYSGNSNHLIYQLERTEQKRRNDKIEKLPELDINFDTASEEQLNKLKLQEIKKVYIQLIDIENKIDKTNGYLDSIKFCVQLITFIIIVPIIISLVLKLFGISLLSLILN